MDFENRYIDELIAIREEARECKNYNLSDKIRNYLDSKHIFIFDSANQQIVYHRKKGSRQDLIKEIKKEQRAEKLFYAWLYSINKTTKTIHHENF
ncbi:hypothetical protein [Aestuariivivens sp. NBU2969]|uniref:hypothetical protein n=1 Tax=Aestuariivivens sp. NBU2969 TaxID=2873267 RepID=UPI001CC0D92E|nr:hypothetical protein [Aestuariivivens sp. NBU2969]